MSHYPFIDRNPCIVAAGKLFGNPCDKIKDAFVEVKAEEKIDAIRKQLGLVDVKNYAAELSKPTEYDTSGAFTEIRHCLRPKIRTYFQEFDEEIKHTIYDSYWNKALGKSRDPTPGLPVGMKPEEVTMGKRGDYSVSAAEVVNPHKTSEELLVEDVFYSNRYPGKQTKYCYKPPFSENTIFGKPSNKDESSNRVKQSLTWFNNDPICHVSRRLAAIRNRTLPPLGGNLDKTGVTDLVPPGHTYGKPNSGDFYGVADLLNECPPSLVRRDLLTFLAYINKLRQTIYKKINEGDLILEELYEDILRLKENSQDSDCSVQFDCIDQIMKRYKIYLDRSKLEPLLLILGILSKEGEIKVRDFISIIDKNSIFPEIQKQYYILPPEFQKCGNKNPYEFEDPKNDYEIQSMPPAGMPTTRLDKNYPIFADSIVNMSHLSEETTARTLISPSIYTQYGLSHRDFFQPRSKEFLGNLFRKINVDLSDEVLDEIFKEGYELDKTGGVCIETFRNILDERAFKTYNKYNN